MDGMNLLVVDQSPEPAEQVNSLLRNSGIKIRVIHSAKALEVKKALDQNAPLLILYVNPDPRLAGLEEVSELATQYGIPIALYADFSVPDALIDRLRQAPCLVIDRDNETHLTATVEQFIQSSAVIRSHDSQRNLLEELGHRYELLLDSARDAIAYVHEGLHVYANRAYLESLKATSFDDIAGVSLLEMMKPAEGDLKAILRDLSRGVFPTENIRVSVTRPDSTKFDAVLTFSPARFNGENCIQMLVHEQDAASELAAELERMRVTDPLTQLSNKRAFLERLEKEVAQKRTSDTAAAVLYVEPDAIQELADELSAAGVDALLTDFARILQSAATAEDAVARISEYGFAILVHRSGMEAVEATANQMLTAIRGHLAEVGDRSVSVSASIGIAILGRLARSPQAVLAGARKAQNEAAEKGDRFQTFRPQLTAVSGLEDDRQWVDRIKYALANQDFRGVQKPIVDLDGEGGQLMENLFYLRDEAGEVPPAKFMAIADRNDLAGLVDRAILPDLLKSFVDARDGQIITLSGNSVVDYAFPSWFCEKLKEACIEGSKVIVQVSAAVALTNLKPVQRMMQELRPLGCRLSISGFTAERRCRQLLEHVDTDFIKLHPSLTESLTGNSANQEAVRGIVDAAEARGATVIADEVTDTPSLAILWQCGVKMIAGAFLKESPQVVGQ